MKIHLHTPMLAHQRLLQRDCGLIGSGRAASTSSVAIARDAASTS
jgi:hypothetical protein